MRRGLLVCILQFNRRNKGKGTRMVQKIVTNTVQNVSEATHHPIRINTLLSKLDNDPIWVELLLTGGFYRSHNAKYLLFNHKELPQLHDLQQELNEVSSNQHPLMPFLMAVLAHNGAMTQEFGLIHKIMRNIINNPTEIKYRSISMNILLSKLENHPIWIEWLMDVGFVVSDDGKRLIFNGDLVILKMLKDILENYCELLHDPKKCNVYFKKLVALFNRLVESLTVQLQDTSILSECDNPVVIQDNISKCMELCMNDCPYFQQLLQTMTAYSHGEINTNKLTTNHVSGIIDAYIHCCNQHDADKDFEFIVKSLTECKVLNCDKFKRNYRNRNNNEESKWNDDIKDNSHNTVSQILDKIHCYFYHCFDIGNRLTIDEKTEVASFNLLSKRSLKIKDILNAKRQIALENSKFNQLLAKDTPIANTQPLQCKCGDLLIIKIAKDCYGCGVICSLCDGETNDDENIYHCPNKENSDHPHGFDLCFVCFDKLNNMTADDLIKQYAKIDTESESESENESHVYQQGYYIKYGGDDKDAISPKHSCLKEEVIKNDIFQLSVKQFDNEYVKAKMHFGCYHRRKFYKNMEIKHILALMFYCNYTEFQSKFSKTYRENYAAKHNHFYWMGFH
eukprot:56956_1